MNKLLLMMMRLMQYKCANVVCVLTQNERHREIDFEKPRPQGFLYVYIY